MNSSSIPFLGTKSLFLRQFIKFCLLIIGACLLSVQMRLHFSPGLQLGPDYQPLPPLLFVLIVSIVAVFLGVLWLAQRIRPALIKPQAQYPYATFLAAAALVSMAALVLLPDLSRLQIIYLAGGSVILGSCFIAFPVFLANQVRRTDIVDDLVLLWKYRALIVLWARYNIISRYSQAVLGVLWIILLPLANTLIFAFVFTTILHVPAPEGVPFVAFLIAGLAHWNLFNQGLATGTVSVTSGMGVISQVYFPREILVIVRLVESLADYLFVFVCLLVIDAFEGIWPGPLYAFLPLLLLLQMMFTLGLVLLTSYLSVFARDIPQLIPVVMQLLFYLTPILYSIESFPERFRFFVALNPLASLVEAYRDILVLGRLPDLTSLYFPLVLGTTVLYVGYKTFKANELRFADFV